MRNKGRQFNCLTAEPSRDVEKLRMRFVSRVYALFLIQFILAFAAATTVKLIPRLNEVMSSESVLYSALALILWAMIILCMVGCRPHSARKAPARCFYLFLYIISYTLITGTFCSFCGTENALTVVGMIAWA